MHNQTFYHLISNFSFDIFPSLLHANRVLDPRMNVGRNRGQIIMFWDGYSNMRNWAWIPRTHVRYSCWIYNSMSSFQLFFFFLTESHYVALADLELFIKNSLTLNSWAVPLSQLWECWDYRHVHGCLTVSETQLGRPSRSHLIVDLSFDLWSAYTFFLLA